MADSAQISSRFLEDLEAVLPPLGKRSDGYDAQFLEDLDRAAHTFLAERPNKARSTDAFLGDLERASQIAASSMPVVSDSDLTTLSEQFSVWRKGSLADLSLYLEKVNRDDPLLSSISLFGTMDYGRLERAHTQTLAWFLGKENHGFEFRLLEALLGFALDSESIGVACAAVESERDIGAGRLDVYAEGRWGEPGRETDSVLAVEAKIDAGEGEEQLAVYDDWLEEHAHGRKVTRIFLTVNGSEPSTNRADWLALSFLELAGILRRVAGLRDAPGYPFLRYYLTGVLRDVCGLEVPISLRCKNPYAAVEYLRTVVGMQ